MKVIFVADIHIKVRQKNVPSGFQKNRLMMLARQLREVNADQVIIGGDLLDVPNPSIEEVGIMYEFLKELNTPGIIVPGNHEMTSKSLDCFRFVEEMLTDLNYEVIRDFQNWNGFDIIPYNILKSNYPKAQSKVAVTHVRGEIPPHVLPEVPLEKFSEYEKVFAGDLHSVTNSQANILYPGSPITTSFHRSEASGSNGYFLIETEDMSHEWVELQLPQLLKKTVLSKDEIIPTDYHHTIYELEGSIKELAEVETNELLSKKIANNVSTPARLSLQGDLVDELASYLQEIKNIKGKELEDHISLYKEKINDSD